MPEIRFEKFEEEAAKKFKIESDEMRARERNEAIDQPRTAKERMEFCANAATILAPEFVVKKEHRENN